MKTYKRFANELAQLILDDHAVIITNEPYMPLSIEDVGTSADGNQLIALSHTGQQNGDLMRDPEILFELHKWDTGETFAEPINFRNDYSGLMQEAYLYDEEGHKTHVKPSIKRDLKSFTHTWFANLREQGFFKANAGRRVLS